MPTDTTSKLITAVTDQLYGEAVAGMTTRQRLAHHFKVSTRAVAYGILRRERVAVAVAAEEQARVDVETALETERLARLAAEGAADAAAETLLEGVS